MKSSSSKSAAAKKIRNGGGGNIWRRAISANSDGDSIKRQHARKKNERGKNQAINQHIDIK